MGGVGGGGGLKMGGGGGNDVYGGKLSIGGTTAGITGGVIITIGVLNVMPDDGAEPVLGSVILKKAADAAGRLLNGNPGGNCGNGGSVGFVMICTV